MFYSAQAWLGELMLPASVADQSVTTGFYLLAFRFVSVRQILSSYI
jgi:hypothetical protein